MSPALARAVLATLLWLATGCGGARDSHGALEYPGEPETTPQERQPKSKAESSRTATQNVPLPRWAQPASPEPAPKILASPPREVVRIAPHKEQDPVDVVLNRRRGRIGSLSLHQAPVDETLRMLAEMGRFNVVLPGEIGARKVSLELRDVSLAGAFRAVLSSARLEARVVTDDILEVRPEGAR